jgi:hypothetical protein
VIRPIALFWSASSVGDNPHFRRSPKSRLDLAYPVLQTASHQTCPPVVLSFSSRSRRSIRSPGSLPQTSNTFETSLASEGVMSPAATSVNNEETAAAASWALSILLISNVTAVPTRRDNPVHADPKRLQVAGLGESNGLLG